MKQKILKQWLKCDKNYFFLSCKSWDKQSSANTVVPQGHRVLDMDGCVTTYTPNLEV